MPRDFDDRDDEYDDAPPRRRARRPEANGMATASLVVGILGCVLFFTGVLAALLGLTAVGLGVAGLSRAKSAGSGRGVSIWGIALGVLAALLGAAFVGAVLLTVQKIQSAAVSMHYENNAKQVVLASHEAEAAGGAFPVPGDTLALGDPRAGLAPRDRLSWRADLLPYLPESYLHAGLNFSRPWDAPANKPTADASVQSFSDALDGPADSETRFRMFVGKGTLTDLGGKRPGPVTITDGTSNTILFAESAQRVPWAQNNEMRLTPGMGAGGLGRPQRDTVLVAMADGSVRRMKKTVAPATLDALITPDGNDIVVAPFE